MSAEFDRMYGPALIITLGALFCFLEGSAWTVLRPSFRIMHLKGVEGVLQQVIWYGGLCCDVLDLKGNSPLG